MPLQPEPRRPEVAPQVPGRARQLVVGEAPAALEQARRGGPSRPAAAPRRCRRSRSRSPASRSRGPDALSGQGTARYSSGCAGYPAARIARITRRRARARASRARARPRSRARAGRSPRARARRRRCCRPASATQASSPASAPGRSGTRVSTTSRRPASVSWRRAIESSSPGSTLPPERIATVVPRGAASTWPPQQRRDADRAGALDDELAALEQHDHRLGGVLVVDHGHAVEPLAEQRRA